MKTRVLLLAALITCVMLSGCAAMTVLHPIQQTDIVRMNQGESYTPVTDGWFLSDLYLKEVAKAKVK